MARYDQNNNPYSWMPAFLRRFMNLDYDEPQAEGRSGYAAAESRGYAPAAQPAANSSWAPPSEPSFKASNMESYTPPTSSGYTAPSGGFAAPPAPRPDTGAAPASAVAPAQIDNFIKPFTYLPVAWFHGAMPPQGIGTFAKEVRTTGTDVLNFYGRWVGFQTKDIFGFGGGVLKSIADILPASSTTTTTTARRIKVTVANDNGNNATNESKG